MNENKNTCMHCGCTNEELFELTINGEDIEVCADCAEALGFVQCAECGEWVEERSSYITEDNDHVCESCYEEWYFTCEDCGAVARTNDGYTVNRNQRHERMVCSSCADDYTRCDDCGELFSSSYVYTDHNGTAVCHCCFDWNDWHFCGRCSRLITDEDAIWDDDDRDAYYCDDCHSRNRRNSHFHDYYYKPTPELKFRSSEPERNYTSILTFGAELEVDCGDDHLELAEELDEMGEPIYMKHDGSLGEEGVEIVTHPCSLAYHQYELRWAEIARVCKSHGFKSHDARTCGLHIHVGRDQMGIDYDSRRRTAGNLVILTHQLWEELVKFSRRTSGQLSDWACKPSMDDLSAHLTDSELTDMAMRTEYNGRYQACNLCNSSTVEFRIFRGSLKRGTIIASLQLVSNLTKYAMTHTPTECVNATWADVVGVEQFKELNKYNTERGL